jgi:uncharacterized protein
MLGRVQLDAVEARIVGSLIEKQLTTPQQYPLSLNALVLACNQTSNRYPIAAYTDGEVEVALSSLKAKGLVRFVLPSHGRSVVRYRQVLDERLALDPRQMALVGVLLLRGPQTVGELRARTDRMAEFASVDDVESDLEGLTRGEEPFVRRLARRPGQKEERWVQLLCDASGVAFEDSADHGDWSALPTRPGRATPVSEEMAELRAETTRLHAEMADVAALRAEVAALRAEVDDLRAAVLGL